MVEWKESDRLSENGLDIGGGLANSKKLLVVTDDLILLNYLDAQLRDLYEVTLAPSGLEALGKLGLKDFDLICSEAKLPDLNVFEIMQTSKLINPHCELLLLTGLGDMEITIHALEKGAFAFVSKPVNPDQLYHRLTQAMAFIQSKENREEVMAHMKKQMTMKSAFSKQSEAFSSIASGLAQGLDEPIESLTRMFDSLMEILQKSNPQMESEANNLIFGFENQVKKARQVISQMGRLGRDNSQGGNLEQGLRLLVDQAVQLSLGRFRDTGIVMTSQIASNLKVLVDPNHFNQVVLNLITNAAGSMLDKRHQQTRAKMINLTGFIEKEYVVLEISDTGPGIPADVKGRIFEPYFTTKKETGGSGLGLHISRLLLQNYGAQLDLHSTGPEGTSFRLYFPSL